jgi:hypothetical protein
MPQAPLGSVDADVASLGTNRGPASSYVVLSVLSFALSRFLQAHSIEPTAQAQQEPQVPGGCFRINHLQRRSGLPAYCLALILE